MARRKIYTDEDAKFIKHLRNRLYYINNTMMPRWYERYDFMITFKNIRGKLGSLSSSNSWHPLIELWSNNSDSWDTIDFRQAAIDYPDYRDLIDEISKTLGYGSIEEYDQRDVTLQNIENEANTAKFIYDEFRRLAKES